MQNGVPEADGRGTCNAFHGILFISLLALALRKFVSRQLLSTSCCQTCQWYLQPAITAGMCPFSNSGKILQQEFSHQLQLEPSHGSLALVLYWPSIPT